MVFCSKKLDFHGLFNALKRGRLLIHHGKAKEWKNGTLRGRYLVIFNAFDLPKSRLIPFSSIHVESFNDKEEAQKKMVSNTESLVSRNLYERIHVGSCLNMMKEKLKRIKEQQLKTEANHTNLAVAHARMKQDDVALGYIGVLLEAEGDNQQAKTLKRNFDDLSIHCNITRIPVQSLVHMKYDFCNIKTLYRHGMNLK